MASMMASMLLSFAAAFCSASLSGGGSHDTGGGAGSGPGAAALANTLLMSAGPADHPTVQPPLGPGSAAAILRLTPVTAVSASASPVAAVAFAIVPGSSGRGLQISCLDQDGRRLWNITVPGAGPVALRENISATGGFDFDQDGWPDLALSHDVFQQPPKDCGRYPMGTSFFSLVRGRTGAVVSLGDLMPSAEEVDLCWDFREPASPVQTKQCNKTQHCVYPTVQWSTSEAPMWGAGTGLLAFAPTYAQWGYYLEWEPAHGGTMASRGKFKYPSCPLDPTHLKCDTAATSWYDAYTNAAPSAYEALGSAAGGCAVQTRQNWTRCTINPHTANGLIMDTGSGGRRLVFFTSSR